MAIRQSSLLRKMIIPLSLVMLLQAGLIYGAVYIGGLVSQLENNAFSILEEQVYARSQGLQNDMVQRWSSVEQATGEIAALIEASAPNLQSDTLEDREQVEQLLADCADPLILMLRRNMVTGAFIVLENGQEQKPGLYLRDGDPLSQPSDSSDLLVERGPASVTQKLNIPMDSLWQSKFHIGERDVNTEYYHIPYMDALANSQLEDTDLGYWSMPFYLNANSPAEATQIITYSLPLRDSANQVLGVLGVEVSVDYLQRELTASHLANEKYSGFLLAVGTAGEDWTEEILLSPVASTGSILSRAIGRQGRITLNRLPPKGIYHYTSANQEIFCGHLEKLELYNSHTPSSTDQWVLVGFTEEAALYAFPREFVKLLTVLTVVMLVLGAVCIWMVGRRITEPITQLVRQLQEADPSGPIQLNHLGIVEIDQLSNAVEDYSNWAHEASVRLSQILKMAEINIGAFEYRQGQDTVYCTDQLFVVLQLPELAGRSSMPRRQFEEIMDQLKGKCDEQDETGDGYIFKLVGTSEPCWVRLRLVVTGDTFLGVATEVTQEMLEKKKLEYDRDYDALTNIYNRRAFHNVARAIFTDPAKIRVGAVMMLDLDNLKFINDTYGHDYGDECIRALASVLRRFSSKQMLVSRQSGDEFLILFHGYESEQEIRSVYEELWNMVNATSVYLPAVASTHLRASAGIAWYPTDADNLEDLIRYADFAMYMVKRTNRGELIEFNVESYNRNSYLLHCREELNAILEQSRVEYYFQPIVSAKNGSIFAYEALMRPISHSIRTPNELISLARSQSRLYQVEHMTLIQAMENFLEQPFCHESSCKVFINSLPSQVLRPDDMENYQQRFADYLPRVVIEMTEEDKSDPKHGKIRRAFMEENQMELALDDFGIGYSSEVTLLEQRPNYVKVDISIIRGIHQDPDRIHILKSLLEYTKERNIKVIAEGVETREEMAYVIEAGVEYLQGFYLCHPSKNPPLVLPAVEKEIHGLRTTYAPQASATPDRATIL